MFYSHEILTERKYGVATIWLVATLGSKSILRKIGRKDILSVNLPKACETVLNPEAPFALRLQSGLLIGIAKVYSQQFQYLFYDVNHAYAAINKDRKTKKANPELNMSRDANPEKLTLDDDPAFDPSVFPELNRRAGSFSLGLEVLSLRDLGLDEDLFDVPSVVGAPSSILAPSSPGSVGGISQGFRPASPFDNIFSGSPRAELGPDERQMLEDPGFEFDEDGLIRDVSPALPALPKPRDSLLESAGGSVPGTRARGSEQPGGSHLDSEDIAAHVQLEHEAEPGHAADNEHDFELFEPQDDIPMPDAEDAQAFPNRSESGDPGADYDASKDPDAMEEEEEEAADNVVRKKRGPRIIEKIVDEDTFYNTNVLNQWKNDYLNMMDEAREKKDHAKSLRNAKSYANTLLFEWGINGELINPELKNMFSGRALLALLDSGKGHLGEDEDDKKRKRREGRGFSDNESSGDESDKNRRVRPRTAELPEDEFGMDIMVGDDMQPAGLEDETMEIGRDAPEPPPAEEVAPSDLPWNQFSAARSHTGSVAPGEGLTGAPFSAGGPPSSSIGAGAAFSEIGSKHGSRVGSSPLTRKSLRPLERVSSVEPALQDVQEEDTGFVDQDFHDAAEFEFFGAGAGVSTQQAAGSQWLQTTMEKESYNYLEFVKNEIQKLQEQEERSSAEGEELSFITFDQLIDPTKNRAMVAAQALSHTLLLATKGLVYLSQEEAFGAIQITVV